jgi:divalent metal cation (Fe/Co/Zn/Cd) transporter
MTPTCIAFRLKGNQIEIISINTPKAAIIQGCKALIENQDVLFDALFDTKQPEKIEPKNLIIRDISNLNELEKSEAGNTTTLETLNKLCKPFNPSHTIQSELSEEIDKILNEKREITIETAFKILRKKHKISK